MRGGASARRALLSTGRTPVGVSRIQALLIINAARLRDQLAPIVKVQHISSHERRSEKRRPPLSFRLMGRRPELKSD